MDEDSCILISAAPLRVGQVLAAPRSRSMAVFWSGKDKSTRRPQKFVVGKKLADVVVRN
jgi:hypothetical protein